jgi:polysaccharide pyruvyl transferase WcaK-like protein
MKVALCGFYGKKNFGDDLMQDCLSEVLSANGKNEVLIFSDLEYDGIQNGLKNKKHLDCDIIVIGGGGILHSNFWIFKNNGIDDLIKSKKEILFLNVNVYSNFIKDKTLIDKVKLLNAKWWVRDSRSSELLKEVEIDSNVLPDISFYKIKPNIVKNKKSKKAIIFPNHYPFFSAFSNFETYNWLTAQKNILAISRHIDWLVHFGWEITISFAQNSNEIDDRIIGAMIFSYVKNKKNVKWDITPCSWREKVEIFKEYDIVYSMRYHTTLLSVINGVPCVDIMHHDKNKYFWKDLGMLDQSINLYSLNEEQLINITNISQDFFDSSNKINDYCTESRSKWIEFENWFVKKEE